MSIDPDRIVEGMDVVGPAGDEIGQVKERRTHVFVLDRSMRRDIYVPYSAVQEVGGRTVVLSVRGDEIGDQGWETTPLLGEPGESDSLAPKEDRVVGTGDPQKRDGWSASSDSYSLDPLDTTEGRQAIEGTDDGERPRPAGIDPETTRRTRDLGD
jgi:hypothetical protein